LAGLAILAVAWWSRRRKLRKRTLAPLALVLVLLAAAVGATLNAWSGYVPSTAAGGLLLTGHLDLAHGGQLRAVRIPVPKRLNLPGSDTYIYTPPGFDASGRTRYPVVYLMHGTPGTSADWFAAGGAGQAMDVLLQHHLVQPMILVAPDLSGRRIADTECLDSTRAGGPQLETYLSSVVVPWVDTHYPTQPDWGHRAIGGMSMGGFCALDQGLRHQELYGVVLALEPYDNPGSGGRAMLGTQADFVSHSPGSYVSRMSFRHPVACFLDVGSKARGADSVATIRLVQQLRDRRQPVLFREEPGQEHTWTMARHGLPYGLVFASAHMPPASRDLGA
jgi:Enterochelin esterase and related enzymes